MNKTFLALLLIGVSYTAYNAAAVSENFEISTTIDHEIVLGNLRAASADAGITKTSDINLGTIYINPAYTEESTSWTYNDSGIVSYPKGKAVVSVPNATIGRFSANISNPEQCNTARRSCGGLRVTGNNDNFIFNIFGGNHYDNSCGFYIKYSGNPNIFTVAPYQCNLSIGAYSSMTLGSHTGTLYISYNPE